MTESAVAASTTLTCYPCLTCTVFEAFCDALQLREVFVVGYSAGTPYALAVAARCRPGLVSAGCLLSGPSHSNSWAVVAPTRLTQ